MKCIITIILHNLLHQGFSNTQHLLYIKRATVMRIELLGHDQRHTTQGKCSYLLTLSVDSE